MLDEEAEEEEEEGHQSGLGDFGFGVVSKIRENDEEAVGRPSCVSVFHIISLVPLSCNLERVEVAEGRLGSYSGRRVRRRRRRGGCGESES